MRRQGNEKNANKKIPSPSSSYKNRRILLDRECPSTSSRLRCDPSQNSPSSSYKNRRILLDRECPSTSSRLRCDPSQKYSADPCEMEQKNYALKQINEIKKYMIGASEFDILEKLIDLNAPKYVIDYQMRKVEQDEQGSLIDTQVDSMFSELERECKKEISEADDLCQPVIPPKKNICPPTSSRIRAGIQRQPLQKIERKNIFSDRYQIPTMPIIERNQPDLRSMPMNIKTEEIESPDENDIESETDLYENLEKLIAAELADANEIPDLLLKQSKETKCEGVTITPGDSFKHTVEKNLATQIDKLSETDENLQPEMAAAILHSEEKGVGLSQSPRQIYDSLFPGTYEKHTIEITPASPSKPRDVMPIPTKSSKSKQSSVKEDAALLEYLKTEEKFSLPEANLQEEESSENEDELLGFVDSQVINEEAATFKVMLDPDGGTTSSQIQMRGSQPPSWFPGYFVAMPDNESVVIMDKPFTVLEKAWQTFRPANVKPRKGAFIIGK